MKHTILSLTALILTSTAALAGTKSIHIKPNIIVNKPTVNVHKPSIHGLKPAVVVHPQINTAKPYHLTHAAKFAHGYCYKGQNHTHWSNVTFSTTCGCRIYFCPSTLVYYYWCAWDDCFYPVTYCPYGRYVF